jgi:predicted RNA-binding Zn-ribbon protein involved in translation (DUF1610 family)
MLEWLRDRWQELTSKACESCGKPVTVTAYRETGRSRKGSWWAGGGVELECPNCGHTFWTKK